ncbi:uncharacterized protein LOC134216072 [Armigeres subalbatus]|uniref:uncharacterized protein LOC134216072 n=1 Tax=Armigeres subalbatus TaxID=124917 RepID=UPI002ED03489
MLVSILYAAVISATFTAPVFSQSLNSSICNGTISGIVPHPDPRLCQMFVSCVFGTGSLHQCDEGHIFNVTIPQCVPGDWNDCRPKADPELEPICANVSYGVFEHQNDCGKFVFCERGRPSVIECLDNEIWFQPEGSCVPGDRGTCLPNDEFCKGKPDGAIPHPDGCHLFIECVDGHSTVVECDRGNVFVEGGASCTVGSSQTCLSLEGVCIDNPDSLQPHPEWCDLAIRCNGTDAQLITCEVNEIFRPDIQFCVPGNPITCTPSRPEVACVGRPDGIVPHPDECNLYIECRDGSSTVQSCSTGQILRPEIPICVTGNQDTCEFLDGVCADRPDRYVIEHPNYCGWHIWCINGQAQVVQCPPNEILRPDMQFCVPGNVDTCETTEIDEMCEGRLGLVIYPHPYYCDQYIRCTQGEVVINQCPPYNVVQPGTIQCVPGNTETCKLYIEYCQGRPDGIIPHPSGCHLFIECRSEVVIVTSCPDGHIFDTSESQCVPGNSETCDHLIEYCIDRPNGVIPHPNRCDLFMVCYNGVTSVESCSWGEILRPDMQVCVPGNSETCLFTPIEQICDNRDGSTVYPHPNDCTLFIRCQQGQTIIESCQEGTILQPGTIQCVVGNADTCEFYTDICIGVGQDVIPHPSGCHVFIRCENNQVTSVESCTRGMVLVNGTCVIGDRESCESWQDICVDKDDQIVEHPNFCDLFLECRWSLTRLGSCTTGLILHPNMQVCSPGDQETCQFYPEDGMCIGRAQGRFPTPDQTQCTEFVTCINGVGTVDACQDGAVLRPRFIDCVPGNEVTCASYPHICLFRPNEFIPHPVRCDMFISCISERPNVVPCPRGEIYNPDRSICVPGSAETCVSFEAICADQVDGRLPHLTDCDLYIECRSGSATVGACPSGQIFVSGLQLCVPGNRETCVAYA